MPLSELRVYYVLDREKKKSKKQKPRGSLHRKSSDAQLSLLF